MKFLAAIIAAFLCACSSPDYSHMSHDQLVALYNLNQQKMAESQRQQVINQEQQARAAEVERSEESLYELRQIRADAAATRDAAEQAQQSLERLENPYP